jgi:hypothetical protein
MTGRRFSSRPPTLPARPERRTEGHQDQQPSPGHPEGIPEFPDALPGSHFYTGHREVPVRHELEVGPADPYYGKGGMAHGVPAPVHHGGRPTPRPEDRHEQEASRRIVREETRQQPEPVPVYVVEPQGGTHPLLRAALQQRIVPAAGADPFMLVPRDPARTSVRLLNESPLQVSPVTIGNEVTDPGAFTAIAAISAAALAAVAPPGTPVTVSWQVSLQGTVTAADGNNMRLVTGSTVLEVAVYPGADGNYPQESVEFETVAGQGVSVTSIAAASGASAIYGAQISVTPLTGAAASVRITFDATLSGGALLPAGMTSYLEIDTQDEIFAYCPSGGPAPVSMISQYQVARGA